MGSAKRIPRVYTLPDCQRCEAVKGWLRQRQVEFEERRFDTDVHVEFIMRNVFGNPPIVEVGSRAAASEELFLDETLNEEKLREVLGSEEA